MADDLPPDAHGDVHERDFTAPLDSISLVEKCDEATKTIVPFTAEELAEDRRRAAILGRHGFAKSATGNPKGMQGTAGLRS